MPHRPLSTPLARPIRLGVFISGGGTTLTNFVREIAAGRLHAEVSLVLASRADCGGIVKARQAGLDCQVVPRRDFSTPEAFSDELFGRCRAAQVDLVTLAGFLSLLRIPEDFAGRVLNIHPALIPSFCGTGYYGHRVHEAVLQAGVKVSGCTVQFADNQYDQGPIILQRCVAVAEDDTPDTLAARVFEAECAAYPESIRLYAAARLEIEGNRVRVLPG